MHASHLLMPDHDCVRREARMRGHAVVAGGNCLAGMLASTKLYRRLRVSQYI
jgi:hypothetical protein